MSERRVVVTGLGATTPLGGTIAETWDGILEGRSGAKPLPAGVARPVRAAGALRVHHGPEARGGAHQGRGPADGPQRAVRGHRRARGDGGCRLPRDRPATPRRRDRHRHRRGLDPARPVGHPQGEGRSARLPAVGPDAHAEHVGGQRLAAARRPGRRPHDRLRVRLRRRVDGHRLRHDPWRPRRHRRRRRHGGRDPPAAVRRLRADAGAVDAQRRHRGGLAPVRHRP